jgi:DNA-binding MarR family transcriptional regulator
LFIFAYSEEKKLVESKSFFGDNEYTIMSEIMDNENVSQREISRKLGVSVSTVNALMNKMIKDGLIKMTQVSQKQVFYMLTPVGLMEKAKKTVRYLKIHYRIIFETKEKIKKTFEELINNYDIIFVIKSDDEMGEIVGIAIDEFNFSNVNSKLIVLDNKKKIDLKEVDLSVLVHMNINEKILKDFTGLKGLTVINLIERL